MFMSVIRVISSLGWSRLQANPRGRAARAICGYATFRQLAERASLAAGAGQAHTRPVPAYPPVHRAAGQPVHHGGGGRVNLRTAADGIAGQGRRRPRQLTAVLVPSDPLRLAGMYRSSAATTRSAPPIPHWPGRLVTIGRAEVFVRSVPAQPGAEPGMCVHGLGGSSTNWTDLMDVLRRPDSPPGPGEQQGANGRAAGWPGWPAGPPVSCEALDLPGNGHSPPPPDGDYSVRAQAAAVAGLIEERDRGPVHLIGNSLGGAVCTYLAARRPDLVKTLTLVSPALPDLRPRPIPARITALRIPGFGPWLLRRATKVPAGRRVAILLRDVYFDPSSVHPARVDEEVAEVERQDRLGYVDDVLLGSANAVVSEYLRRGPQTLWRDAARITAEVLAIYGSHDRLVDPRMAVRAARTFRHARVLVLSRTGHVAQMERPQEVASEMRIMMSAAAARAARQTARR
jgi:pimeloyl-ACP methyl ester carboxylesterase